MIHKLHPTHSNLLRQFKTPSDSQSQISVRQFKTPSTNWNLHPTNSSNLHPSDKVNNKQISTIQNQISSNKFKSLSDTLKTASFQRTQISSDKFESPSTSNLLLSLKLYPTSKFKSPSNMFKAPSAISKLHPLSLPSPFLCPIPSLWDRATSYCSCIL